MVKVFVRNGEPIEKALKRFKRNCNNAGLIRDMRRLTQYEKPASSRRKERKERIKNLRRIQTLRHSQ